MCLPEIDHLPDQRVDPPRERDFEEEQEDREREGEARFEMWRADGYPERERREC